MTHVLVLSAEVRRDEHTLNIGTMFGPTLTSKSHRNFNVKNEIKQKPNIPPNFYLPT